LLPENVFILPHLAQATALLEPLGCAQHPDKEDTMGCAAAFLLVEWLMRRKPGGLEPLQAYLEGLRRGDSRRAGGTGPKPWGGEEDLVRIQGDMVEFWRRNRLRIRIEEA
jgi:hypothetical protein